MRHIVKLEFQVEMPDGAGNTTLFIPSRNDDTQQGQRTGLHLDASFYAFGSRVEDFMNQWNLGCRFEALLCLYATHYI